MKYNKAYLEFEIWKLVFLGLFLPKQTKISSERYFQASRTS